MTDTTTSPLKQLRLDRGFTQEELANEAGVSRSTVQKIESGGEPRYPNMYRKIADVLGVQIEDIRAKPDRKKRGPSQREVAEFYRAASVEAERRGITVSQLLRNLEAEKVSNQRKREHRA